MQISKIAHQLEYQVAPDQIRDHHFFSSQSAI